MPLTRKSLLLLEPLLLVALLGSMWTIGYLTVPVLFSTLADKQMAGNIAGEMFRTGAYFQFGSVAALSVLWTIQPVQRSDWCLLLLLAAMTAISLWGIQPYMAELKRLALPVVVMESELRSEFAMWHGISSILYLLQSLLGAWLLLKRWQQKPRQGKAGQS